MITKSSGNVFRDLGYDTHTAENLRVRSELAAKLSELIKSSGWSQIQAARIFRVSQPRISDLMRGKIDLFTVDTLINMLGLAGSRTTFQVVPYSPTIRNCHHYFQSLKGIKVDKHLWMTGVIHRGAIRVTKKKTASSQICYLKSNIPTCTQEAETIITSSADQFNLRLLTSPISSNCLVVPNENQTPC